MKIKEIKKDFNKLRYEFSKSKISEFRRSLYNIKKQKNLSATEIKETENLLELEKNLSSLKKYYDYDGIEYRGIRDIGNLFNEVAVNKINKDYYKPIVLLMVITLNMKVMETKTKICHLKNILILLDHI